MKLRFILTISCAFMLLNPGIAMSDEISDLNKKIEMLQRTVDELKDQLEALKKKQEEQNEEVGYITESVEALESQPSASSAVSSALSKNVNIGGHFKFYLLDRSDGERNNSDQRNNLSAGISDLWLYISKNLSDWLSLDVAPRIKVTAAATPRLGGDISRENNANVSIDLDEAYMTVRLPYQVEAKIGAFYPLFSEEYARQSWWHEQYNGNPGLVTMQSWHDTGIELYHTFDFENFSLPVYFYPYLNGARSGDDFDTRFSDNNGSVSSLLHLAPEIYISGNRIRILGSIGYGKWDDEDDKSSLQYLLGSEISIKSLSFLGEYIYRGRNGVSLLGGGNADWKNKGYFLRAMYTLNEKWRFLVKYSDVDQPFVSSLMLNDNYKVMSFAVNYWFTEESTIISQVDSVDAERSDASENLEYLRYTIGWRTTF